MTVASFLCCGTTAGTLSFFPCTPHLPSFPCIPLPPGAREVVLLDREPMALQCALISAVASGLGGGEEEDEGEGGESVLEEQGRGQGKGPAGRRRHVTVQPLPREQVPPYASLRLAEQLRQGLGQGQGQHRGEERGQAKGDGSDADASALLYEHEWRALARLARAMAAGEGADPAEVLRRQQGQQPGGQQGEQQQGESDTSAGSDEGVLRAHVFDWHAPPPLASLLPPPPGTPPQAAARMKRRFDVILACDGGWEGVGCAALGYPGQGGLRWGAVGCDGLGICGGGQGGRWGRHVAGRAAGWWDGGSRPSQRAEVRRAAHERAGARLRLDVQLTLHRS